MFLPPSEKGMVIFPGFDGGAEWGGAAYDPATGFLYINANQVPWTLTMIPSTAKKRRGGKTLAEYGEIVYSNNCMSCHGKELEGGGRFPSLQHLDKKYTANQALEIINNGRGGMPPFKQIPADDKKALLSFLLNLKDGKTPYQGTPIQAAMSSQPEKPVIPYTMTGYPRLRTPEGYPASKPPWGTLTTINLNTGETMWQIPLGEYPELAKKGIPVTGTENYGGPVVTAGGLLFIAATLDEKIRAFDKTTGKLLWEAPLPAAGYATPSVYEANGKQYIVIACGGGKLGTPSGDTYVAFALP
jgi:quinoprotein glucose dehydrogenase